MQCLDIQQKQNLDASLGPQQLHVKSSKNSGPNLRH